MYKVLVKSFCQACPGKNNMVRRTDRPDMTIAVDWVVKNQTNTKTHALHEARSKID